MGLRVVSTFVTAVGVALALTAGAPPATAAAAEQAMQAAWHGTSWSVPIELRGRASPKSEVRASAPCAIGTCTATTTAGSKGRWELHFDGIVKPGTRKLPVTLASGARSLTRTFVVTAPAGAAPGPGTVMVIGDSLAVGTAAILPGLLPDRRITTQAIGGRQLLRGTAVFANTPLDARIQVAVFSLFTNNDPASVDAFRDEVRSTLDRLGERRCAVWFTIRRPAVRGVTFTAANKALQAMAADPATGGRLLVVPWSETITGDPKILGKDRVHPTPAGYRLRAQMTADAIGRCPVRPA